MTFARGTPFLFLAVIGFVSPAAAQLAQPAHESVTFKSGVHLVIVPVVVRNSAGQAVGNLTRDDFQLFDKGRRQTITTFTVEKAGAQAAAPAASGNPEDIQAKKQAVQPAVAPGNFIVYLFDDVHLDFGDLARVRDAAGRNIDAAEPASRMAIFTTSGRNVLDFTEDRAKLHAALLRLRPHPLARTGGQDCPDVDYFVADLIRNKGDQQALDAVTAETMSCMHLLPQQVDMARHIAMDAARRALEEGEDESRISLVVLSEAVRRIAAMPGHRMIVLASPGFLVLGDLLEDELDVVDRATRSNVIINSLDARGLYTINPVLNVEQGNDSEDADPPGYYQRAGARARSDVLADFATDTGGTFVRHTNDFDAAFRRLTTTPEYIYMLGFAPQNLKMDGSIHSLKVKLSSPAKLTLEWRRRYIAAENRESELPIGSEDAGSAVSRGEQIGELPAELHTEFSRVSDTAARLNVQASVDLTEWQHRRDVGHGSHELSLVLALFDEKGHFVTGWQKKVQVSLADQKADQTPGAPRIKVASGFNVPPGSYRIRLVVRDAEGRLMTTANVVAQIP